MLILGIDDAGRGPIIGPMTLAGVLIKKSDEEFLKKHGVKDSKQLSNEKRFELAKIIKELSTEFYIVKSTPIEIDEAINSKLNLNTLEAIKTAEIINHINSQEYQKQNLRVVVDCPSTNTLAWKTKLLSYIKHPNNLEISCEHKADVNHPSVSAASILAKCLREEEVEKIKKRYGNIGSGYPADPYTKEFLTKRGKELSESGIFRKSWATWKDMFPGAEQSTLF